ncbi:MAG: DNA polymerase III subunit beta [Paludibacteraceae bacterium]|jgi:DNA polymerase-3 subunit beta|nr:DNA polymerase III subunit beta [Paludibacteraceae bacterium]MEE0912921.1 DNA polymerase III subunit beta [Paludibacteraceae bacterium]
MKFTVSSVNLLNHLQTVSRVISSKNTNPILDNFLFKVGDNKLLLMASDSETMLQSEVQLISSEGSCAVALSSKIMLDSLKEFSDQPLTFEVDEETFAVKIVSEGGVYKFVGTDGREFPTMPESESDTSTVLIPAQTLFSGINKTIFAMSTDEMRPIMCGIYFDITPEGLTFVGSDGHKMVRVKTLAAKGEKQCSFILPKKPTSLLKNILAKESEDVKVEFGDKNACFILSDYKMFCRLIEGKFPNYNSVIPTNNQFKATIDRVALLNTLRRISIFSNQATNLVKMEFKANEMILSASDLDFYVSAQEKIACSYDGEPMNIGFKSSFFVEMLSNLTSDEVIVELSDPSRAGLILPLEQDENEDTLMLLMPMKLND